MNTIADSSSLIVLAQLDALWLLTRVCRSVIITATVEHETVTQGLARGYVDAQRLQEAMAAGRITVITPSAAERRLAQTWQRAMPALSHADCQTLACARERGLTLIMEEQRGRNLAVTQGIQYVTMQVLPLHGFVRAQLTFVECDDLLRRVGQVMRTDTAVVTVLRAAAQEIERLRTTR